MNKLLLNGVTSAMMSLGLCSAPVQAYSSYANRSYLKQSAIDQSLSISSPDSVAIAKDKKGKEEFSASMMQQVSSDVSKLALTLGKGSEVGTIDKLDTAAQLEIKKQIPVAELIVIDQAVQDKHVFYKDLKPGTDVVEIESNADGLEQLKAILSAYQGLDALHIVSHAEDGELLLGAGKVNEDSLKRDVKAFSIIDGAMTDSADILLYGCNLAKSEKGERLLQVISEKANVDVAASSDFTGNDSQKADWNLEIATGHIDSELPFSANALKSFNSVLAINDAGGRTINMTGFTGGYSVTKSYDVDGSGYVLQISTDSGDGTSLYSGGSYLAANFTAGVVGLKKVYVAFSAGNPFDIDSIDVQSTTTRNYVFTPSAGGAITSSVSSLSANTQVLNFTGITQLAIERQDGGDLEPFFIEQMVIKNAGPTDTTPPVFQNSTPSVSGTTISQTTLTVRLDESGTAYYVVVPDGAGAPSSAQVKAGQNSSSGAALQSGSINITSGGSDFTDNITGLSAGTAYDLYVAAEDGEPNLQASPTRVDFSTNPQNSNGGLSAAAGVTEPVALDTTIDTSGEALSLFDFTLSDGGGDSLTLGVTEIVLNVGGTASDTIRGNIDWRLDGPDASDLAGVYSAPADTITFTTSISVADGGSEVYTVSGHYTDNTNITDGQTITLSVDGDTDLTVTGTGTLMGATSAVTNGSGTETEVVASALAFTTQPAGSVSASALTTQPVVTARDAFGNTDTDFTEIITLTEASAGALSGDTTITAVSGVSTFTDVVYTATADQQSFTLTANDEDGTGSNLPTVDANAVTSDVVATQLVFDTQPVPLSVSSASATNFTTVPVVSARDAGNVVDTGYATGITLAEVNGAGSATMSATGDTDGSVATVTITPSSGVSTFTSMQITYTNSGGSNENFNLQASSGGLTTANSSQLTGVSPDSDGDLSSAAGVTEPVGLNWSVDTVGEAVDLFDFTLTDGGALDGLAMAVSSVVVNVSGTSTDAERAKVTWRLNGNDASNVVGVYNAGGDTITFSGLSISIADGTSEVYTINGYFNDNTGLTHGATAVLSLDGDTDLTIGSGTQMGATSAVTNGSGTVFTDNIDPVVTSVAVPANSTYAAAANLDFTVNFDETVTVNTSGGTPRLTLTVGATTRYATYLSGSPGTALTFRYTVPSGDEDLDGLAVAGTLDTNLGTIRDSAGNDINTTLNSVGSLASVLVDAQAPVVAEVTPVVTPNTDSTPVVTFSTTEAGNLLVGGSCGSSDEGATGSGNQTITLMQPDNSSALASGTYSDCTVTVTDSAGNASNVLTLSSFVIDVTDPTVDTNAGRSLNEGDTGVGIANTALSSSDNVSAAANVTYTLVSAPSNGTLRNSGSALAGGGTFTQANLDASAITYDHDGSETVSDSFTFTVTDGAGNVNDNGAANFTFNFTIAAVNDAPATTADADTTNEENAVMIDVLANDSDVDGALVAASVTVASGPANGGTSVNSGTGVITYTPNADFEGVDSFTYTVEDNNSLASSPTTVTVTVNPINDPPVAVADSVSTLEATLVAINVAANDSDVDTGDNPDPTTIVVVGAASNGTAVFNGGTNQVDYTPNGGFIGTDSFTYTIDDGTGTTSNLATVTVTVNAANSSPVAVNDSATTAMNTAITIDVASNDTDSDPGDNPDPSTISIVGAASNGMAVFNAGTQKVDYTPNTGFVGTDSFTYRIDDQNGATSNVATVSVTVQSVAPTITAVSIPNSIHKVGDTVTATISVNADPDDYTSGSGGISGTINGYALGSLSKVSDTSYLATFTVADGGVDASANSDLPVNFTLSNSVGDVSAAFTTAISQSGDAVYANLPQITLSSVDGTLGEDGDIELVTASISGSLNNQWPDAVTVNLSYSGTATTMTDYTKADAIVVAAGSSSGSINVTGVADTHFDAASAETVIIDISSVSVGSEVDEQQQILSIVDAESAPVVTLSTSANSISENVGSATISATLSHPTYEAVSVNLAYSGTATVGSDYLTPSSVITIAAGLSNADAEAGITAIDNDSADVDQTIIIDIASISGGSATESGVQQQTVTLTNDDNAAPTLSGTPLTQGVVGVAYSFTVLGEDLNVSDILTYQLTSHPSWMSISPEGLVSGIPGESDAGTISGIVVSVSDGQVSTSLAPFDLVIDSDLDGDGEGDATDLDIDGDGITNAFEIEHGLDPLDASDALGDLDGDGESNLQEFLNSSDPNVDDYGPVISADNVVTIDAMGLLTDLPAGLATATDALDGDVVLSHNLASELLAPGTHEIIWSAVDAANNVSTFNQTLNIQPLANWQVDQETGEGNTLSVSLYLNGEAPEYPVVANYSVSGTASNPDDHNALSGTLTIHEGQSAHVDVMVVSDLTSEADETILFTLDSISNAAIGVQQAHQITISEVNHAPEVSLSTSNTLVDITSGTVTITAIIDDVDVGDSHTTIWSASNGLAGTASGTLYSFDPAVVGVGTYQISVIAQDDAVNSLSGSAVITMTVLDQELNLGGGNDSDGDGINDAAEGAGDSDGDSVPNFADSVNEENVLALFPVGGEPSEGAWFMEAQPGLSLKLNVYASASGDFSPLLDESDIVDASAIDRSDTGHEYTGGIFDFVVSDMPVQGETVFVVLPQLAAIPENPVYRKEINGRWSAFVEDDNNFLSSAPGERGICPPPGSLDYLPGLTEGHFCVQLGIEDGGENDSDGEANGSIIDPGGVASVVTVPATVSTGGGSISWPSLLLLSLIAFARVLKRFAGVGFVAMGLSSVAQANDWLKNTYATAQVGGVKSGVSDNSVQRRFDQAGITNTTIHSVDDNRIAYSLGVGYSLSPNWAVELAYLDLKQVDVAFTSTQSIANLEDVMPESGDGMTLSVLHRCPLDEKASARIRAGVFDWRADYTTSTGVGSGVGRDTDSGTDWYLGLGLDHKITDQLDIFAEFQHFNFDRETSRFFNVGLAWRFEGLN